MAAIEVRHLYKRFEQKGVTVEALSDINLTVEQGDIYGIIGMSGAGKSTLVRCLNFLEKPTEGQVLIEGQELGALTEKELRGQRSDIAMIFQNFNLLMQKSVLDNVCFPMQIQEKKKKEARERARELLKTVGLSEKEKAYPAQLSGGQKQRVAIARAIATNPKVLLCDEATSALDPNTTKAILQLLKEINQSMGITVVIITHEMAVIEAVCDRVAIIDKSHIAEIGEVSRVFAEPKSKIGRQLILGDAAEKVEFGTGRLFRIIFDGLASSEPVISNVVLACKVPVNIMYAATKDVNGTAMGQMIIQLPEDETDAVYLSPAGVDGTLSMGIYDMARLPKLPQLTADNVSALTVTAADGKSLSLTASEGVWLRSGQDVTQWSGTLTEALGQLTLLRCIDYRPSTGVAELCGLTEPAVTLTVTYRAIAGETELTLRVGAQRDGGYYATVNDDDTIYLLPAAPAEALAALEANGLNG